MAIRLSDQLRPVAAGMETVPDLWRVPLAIDGGSRVRSMIASFTTGAALPGITVANGDVVIVGRLTTRARVVGGRLTTGAMGAGATASVGVYSFTQSAGIVVVSAARYGSAISVAAAAAVDLANTDALNFLDLVEVVEGQQILIGITAGGANWANGQSCKVRLDYLTGS